VYFQEPAAQVASILHRAEVAESFSMLEAERTYEQLNGHLAYIQTDTGLATQVNIWHFNLQYFLCPNTKH